MRAEVFPYRLPLLRPWRAARKTLCERIGALVRLTDADEEGWGDCAPLPSRDDPTAVVATLASWSRQADFAHLAALPPEARWAIDAARADLAARQAGAPLWRHLGGTSSEIDINAALGALDDDLPARLALAAAAGYRLGKIKVGVAPLEEEIARLLALTPPFPLRLDANRRWTDQEARRFLLAIRDLPIDAVEEPLAEPTLDKLAELQRDLPYALALDESLPDFHLSSIIDRRPVRRLVLKPARLGDIATIAEIIRRARNAGIETVLSSVIDSAIGVAATAHLAAALAPDYPHGLDTSRWLVADLAAPLPIVAGRCRLTESPGLGLTPHRR